MGDFQKWLDDVPGNASVAEAARRAVRSRLGEVVRLLPLAAHEHNEDIEHVHRLRVTVRRSGAVLKAYDAVLPAKESAKLDKRLKKVRKAAGPARDLDVFLERLRERVAPAPLLARLRDHREAAQASIVKVHEKLRGGEKLQQLADAVTSHTPSGRKRARRVAKRALAEWAPERLADSVERFIAAMPSASPTAQQLHQFRIEGKRVRYAIEALAPGLPDEARERAYPEIKALQDRLGGINDHAAAAKRLSGWLEDSGGAEREFLEQLIEEERAQLESKSDEFSAWWDDDRAAEVVSSLHASPAEPAYE